MPVGPGSSKFPTPRAGSHPSWPKNTMMPTSASRNGGAVASSSRTPRPIEAPGQRSAPDIAYSAASDQRDEERGDDEFDGGRQVGGQVGGHRLPGAQRAAQIPGEQPAEEAEVLGEERVVQAEPLPLRRDQSRATRWPRHTRGPGRRAKRACSTKITSDKISRMSTAAESRRVKKRSIVSPPHRDQVADGVAAEVGDQAQQQHRDARDAGHPPLTEQLAQRAGGVGAELGGGRLLPQPQE